MIFANVFSMAENTKMNYRRGRGGEEKEREDGGEEERN